MIALLVVSHSRPLAQAAVELAVQMVPPDQRPPIRIAAGLDDGSLGTDATAVSAALEELAGADGVLVFVDLGSALLSAQMALEFVDPDLAARVVISPAPMVEGLVAGVVTAAGGAPITRVDAEARSSLNAKIEQLADESPSRDTAPSADGLPSKDSTPAVAVGAGGPTQADGHRLVWDYTMTNVHGLHARPAAAVVSALSGLDARVVISNATSGAGPADARSVSSLAALQLHQGQVMQVEASGAAAPQARQALDELAARQFGDATNGNPSEAGNTPGRASEGERPQQDASPAPVATAVVEGPVHIIDPDPDVAGYRAGSAAIEQARFDQARHHVAGYLDDQASGPFAAIFNAQKALLNDASLRTGVSSAIDKGASSIEAVSATMAGLSASFDKLSDPYLRERGQDVRSLDRLLRSAIVGASLRWPREAPAGVWVLPELDALSAATADTARCRAIITLRGGDTGHGAIIARQRGIALLLGYPDAARFTEGQEIRVDTVARRARPVNES